jgi:hypothetical protein
MRLTQNKLTDTVTSENSDPSRGETRHAVRWPEDQMPRRARRPRRAPVEGSRGRDRHRMQPISFCRACFWLVLLPAEGSSGATSSADVFIHAALACSGAQGASPQSSILHCTMETLGSVARAAGGAATANGAMKLGSFRLGLRFLRSIGIAGCFCRASNHVSVLSGPKCTTQLATC